MSTIYDKTDNYGLNLYGDNDPADLREGYNGSMRTIDTTLKTHLNRIESVEARETHDEEVVKTLIGDNTVDNATIAKIKWDKAGTDATAANGKADNNTAILNALGANTTDAATTLKNSWNDKYTKSQADERFVVKAVAQDWCVGIGDSYFEGFRTTNPPQDNMFKGACDILGLTAKNYAEGGAGFKKQGHSAGTTFLTQIQQAAYELRNDLSRIKYVIIAGGRNDNRDLPASIAYDTINTARQKFPYSKIIVIPMMYDKEYIRVPYYGNYCTIANAAQQVPNTFVIEDAFMWGLFKDDIFIDIHPSTQGAKLYAQYIAAGVSNLATPSRRESVHMRFDDNLITTAPHVAYLDINRHIATAYARFKLKTFTKGQVPLQIDSTAKPMPIWWMVKGWTDLGAEVNFEFNGVTFKESSATIPDESFVNLHFDFTPYAM